MSKLRNIYTWLCMGWSIPAIIHTAFQPWDINEIYYGFTVFSLLVCVVWHLKED